MSFHKNLTSWRIWRTKENNWISWYSRWLSTFALKTRVYIIMFVNVVAAVVQKWCWYAGISVIELNSSQFSINWLNKMLNFDQFNHQANYFPAPVLHPYYRKWNILSFMFATISFLLLLSLRSHNIYFFPIFRHKPTFSRLYENS